MGRKACIYAGAGRVLARVYEQNAEFLTHGAMPHIVVASHTGTTDGRDS